MEQSREEKSPSEPRKIWEGVSEDLRTALQVWSLGYEDEAFARRFGCMGEAIIFDNLIGGEISREQVPLSPEAIFGEGLSAEEILSWNKYNIK